MNTNGTVACRCISAVRTRRLNARALGVSLCALGIAAVAGADDKASYITFDAPGAGNTNNVSVLQDPFNLQGTGCYFFSDCGVTLNDSGTVTGDFLDANNVYHGFVRYRDGKITAFDAPGADTTANDFNGTFPNSISDSGVITGFYVDKNGGTHGFLRSPEGGFRSFDVTFDGVAGSFTVPIAINLEGFVVGYAGDPNGLTHGFLRRPNDTFATWIGPGGCTLSSNVPACFGTGAFGINLFGTISSHFEDTSGIAHGLVRSAAGKLTAYDAPGAGSAMFLQGTDCPGCATPINLFGAIAGYYIDATNVVHGFLRGPWGEITPFDAPPSAGSQGFGCFSDCSLGLNDLGAITGSYTDASGTSHGFLRSLDGKITSFDAPGADTTAGDFNGTFPISINDQGTIAGYYIDTNNVMHGFLRLAGSD